MKFKFYTSVFPPKFNSYNDNGYFENLLAYYTKDKNSTRGVEGTILFWLGSTEQNYFFCPLRDEEYQYGTPFIFIHRTKDNIVFSEYDKDLEDALNYPYYIQCLGCDDGHKAWRFKTEEEFFTWYSDIVTYLLSINELEMPEDFSWEFWDLFDDNQVWVN